MHTNTFAARMGRWSARHRKTAIWGWIAFVAIAFVIGNAVGTQKPDHQDYIGQSGQAAKLFGDLLERSYISKIELYGGEKIQYVSDKIEGDQASVISKLVTKTNTEVPIEYRMLKKGDRWLVYDVII